MRRSTAARCSRYQQLIGSDLKAGHHASIDVALDLLGHGEDRTYEESRPSALLVASPPIGRPEAGDGTKVESVTDLS